ncbi:hypothetical protein [Pseudomonas nicosulfuronedens]
MSRVLQTLKSIMPVAPLPALIQAAAALLCRLTVQVQHPFGLPTQLAPEQHIKALSGASVKMPGRAEKPVLRPATHPNLIQASELQAIQIAPNSRGTIEHSMTSSSADQKEKENVVYRQCAPLRHFS